MSVIDIFPIEKLTSATEAIIGRLSEAEYDVLIRKPKRKVYRKDEFLFREGELAHGLYVIHKGAVMSFKASKKDVSGAIMAGQGELIGHHATFAEGAYTNSAVVTKDNSIISFIPKEDLFSLIMESPKLGLSFLKAMGHDSGVILNHDLLKSKYSSIERVATEFILLREKAKSNRDYENEELFLEISRKHLSQLTGLSEDVLTRAISELKKKEVKSYKQMAVGSKLSIFSD